MCHGKHIKPGPENCRTESPGEGVESQCGAFHEGLPFEGGDFIWHIELIPLAQEGKILKGTGSEPGRHMSGCVYCHEGFAVISFQNGARMIKQGERFVLTRDMMKSESCMIMGEGMAAYASVVARCGAFDGGHRFDDGAVVSQNTSLESKELRYKVTADDLFVAAKISLTNFRGARALLKSRRNVLYDEELKRAISRLDKFYVTYIAYIIGLCVSCIAAYEALGGAAVVPAMALWSLFDWVIINPLIYLAFLPKPVGAHIRPADGMTDAEKKLYDEAEAQIGMKERNEKILKKYKNSGRNFAGK